MKLNKKPTGKLTFEEGNRKLKEELKAFIKECNRVRRL
jgi:hypothetical protein